MKYDKNLEDVNDYLQNELFKPDEMIILPPAGGKWSGLLEICAKAGGLGYDIDDVKEAVREILEKEYPEEYDAKTVNNIIDKAYGLSAPESIGDKKWKYVTTEQVWNAIIGSPLMEIVQDLQAVTKPTLPLQATLSKALVLAGAVMAGKIENAPSFDDPVDRRSGADLSRFKINTGDGQTTNLWGFIVGQSASGKDIGGRLDKLARYYGLSIGSCGSAEG